MQSACPFRANRVASRWQKFSKKKPPEGGSINFVASCRSSCRLRRRDRHGLGKGMTKLRLLVAAMRDQTKPTESEEDHCPSGGFRNCPTDIYNDAVGINARSPSISVGA
jgi:hypothetical protein